jgi:hypothetical protein
MRKSVGAMNIDWLDKPPPSLSMILAIFRTLVIVACERLEACWQSLNWHLNA